MEQVYRIRNMRKFEGKSLRKIANETGFDFSTVKKYVQADDFNQVLKPKQQRNRKLNIYRDLIVKWLDDDRTSPYKQQHTAKRIFDRLKEMYPDSFNASERAVRSFVAELKEQLSLKDDGYLPLEHPPGEAQCDFGETRFVENGITYDGFHFNISYPYSNGGHTQLFKSENQECLLEAMKAIFEHIGGVPTSIWFDNMSTAVKKIREYGERDMAKGFLRFMMHNGFRSNFCNPDSGNEKGSVENKVGYHRRNLFVPIPEFKDLKEYNKKLLLECDKDMDRGHYKGRGLIKDLFQEDRKAFLKLPDIPFEVFRHEFAKADNYGKIKFDGRTYSVSPDAAKSQVMIKAGAYDVEILDLGCKTIIKHKRLYGVEKESMNWIPYLELLSKRPAALKYTGIYNQLPSILKDYLDECGHECKKSTLRVFARMVARSDFETAISAFEQSILHGVDDEDSIWAFFCRLTSGSLPETEILLSDTVPKLSKYVTDIRSYDDLLTPGGIQ